MFEKLGAGTSGAPQAPLSLWSHYVIFLHSDLTVVRPLPQLVKELPQGLPQEKPPQVAWFVASGVTPYHFHHSLRLEAVTKARPVSNEQCQRVCNML